MTTQKKYIFLSYGRGDSPDIVQQIAQNLNSLSNEYGLQAWYDKFDLPSVLQFTDEIAHAIDQSQYLLLFIGEHALNSEWCVREWRYALQKCVPIIPILIQGTWDSIGDRLPIQIKKVNGIDATRLSFAQVMTEIRQRIIQAPYPLTIPIGTDDLPTSYIDRPQYIQSLKTALGIGDRTATGVGKIAGFVGIGGIGKTILASALANDCETRRTFDYIFWLTIGDDATADSITSLLYRIGAYFGDKSDDYADVEKAKLLVMNHLSGKKTLLILDDVWEKGKILITGLRFPNLDCRLLITTRSAHILESVGAKVVVIDKLTTDEGLALLSTVKPPKDEAQKAIYIEILNMLGGHPLAIQLSAQQLYDYDADGILRRLKKNLSEDNPFGYLPIQADNRNTHLELSLRLSYGELGGDNVQLKADLQRRFRALGIFAPSSRYDLPALKVIWQEADEDSTEDQAVKLRHAGLLTRTNNRFGHHSLLTVYAHALLVRVQEDEHLLPIYADFYTARAKTVFFDTTAETWVEYEDDLPNIIAVGNYLMAVNPRNKLDELNIIEFVIHTLPYILSRMEKNMWSWVENGLMAVYRLQKIYPASQSSSWFQKTMRRVRQWRQTYSTEDNLILAEVTFLTVLGHRYRLTGDPQKALDYYEKALTLAQSVDEKNSEKAIRNSISLIWHQLGDNAKAQSYLAQESKGTHSDIQQRIEAARLSNMGAIQTQLGDYQQALQHQQQALSIIQSIGDKSTEATILSNIGYIFKLRGEVAQSIQFFEQSLALARAVGNKSTEGISLSNIGSAYNDLGDFTKALHYYEQALDLMRQVGAKSNEGSILNGIGSTWDRLGDKHKAITYFQEALPLLKQARDVAAEAITLCNLATALDGLNDKSRVLDYYTQALSLFTQIGDKAQIANTHNSIGVYYAGIQNRQQATRHYQEALMLARSIGDKMVEARTLNNLGNITADNHKALEYHLQALPLRQSLGDKVGEAHTYYNIGATYQNLGDTSKAIDYIERAIQTTTSNDPRLAKFKSDLQRLKTKRGDVDLTIPLKGMPYDKLMKQCVAIYRAKGETGLRQALEELMREENAKPEDVELTIQMVKLMAKS